MDSLSCGICLDTLCVPVCTPCGHLCCEACLTTYIETSADAMNASCPTCRACFSIAIPDLRFVPKKYHSLLIPSVRRVFISTDPAHAHGGPLQSRRDLCAQIASLNEKVHGLIYDKTLLIDRCEAALRAREAHAQGERNERLAKERLERELRELRKKYESVKGKYKALKASSSQENAVPAKHVGMKRKGVPESPAPGPLGALDTPCDSARPTLRIPKRPRLLGSPFDLSKRIETRKSRRLIDEDEDGVREGYGDEDRDEDGDGDEDGEGNSALRESDLSSSVGPQRSGLPGGDIFSPATSARRAGGRGCIQYGSLGNMRPAWLLSPEEIVDHE